MKQTASEPLLGRLSQALFTASAFLENALVQIKRDHLGMFCLKHVADTFACPEHVGANAALQV